MIFPADRKELMFMESILAGIALQKRGQVTFLNGIGWGN
jgi:hypothetical protein